MDRFVSGKEMKVLLYGGSVWYFAEGMFGPLLAVFTEEVGGSILDISWAWSIYLIFYGVLSIVLGKLSDHMDKAKLMVAGYGINALFTFMYVFVDSPTTLLVVQAGLGIAAAMATPTWDALYDEYSSAEEDGTAWGLAGGMASIVTGIAIVLGGLVVEVFSFNTLFITMGVIQTIAFVYQARILKMPKPC